MTLVKFKAKNKAASRALHGPDGEKSLSRAKVAEHLWKQHIKTNHTSAYFSIILAENAKREGIKSILGSVNPFPLQMLIFVSSHFK